MYKKLIIIILSLFLYLDYIDATPFEDVSPEPDRCRQRKNLIVCASAASGMLMKYWSEQLFDGKRMYEKKGCNYTIVFRRKFGTADGRTAKWEDIKKALEDVATDEEYLKISKDKVSIKSEACKLHGNNHQSILFHMKANKDNYTTRLENSPWDRPGVLTYIENINYGSGVTIIESHAVLAYGYFFEIVPGGYIVSLHIHDGRNRREGRETKINFNFTSNHEYSDRHPTTRLLKKMKNRFVLIWPEEKCK